MQDLLAQLVERRPLSEKQAEDAFNRILSGEADPAQIAALLSLIQARRPTIDEIVGAARAMRAHAQTVPYTPPPSDSLIDTCGTGGAAKTFNVSTAAAFVVAGAQGERRVRVAKHGNRSRTGRGSAEALAALAVNVDAPPEVQARCLDEVGVCFCFAIRHHPAARHAAPVRQALAFPTLFNLVGPLTNPALAPVQLMGVFDPEYLETLAHALHRLGSRRALIVHGAGGMDEISTLGPTRAARLDELGVRADLIDPTPLALPTPSIEDLRARDLEHAARMLQDVLDGAPGPVRDIVALNAGAALHVAQAAPTLAEGLRLARRSIDSGAARAALEGLVRVSAS